MTWYSLSLGTKDSRAPPKGLVRIYLAGKNRLNMVAEWLLHNFRNKKDYVLTKDNSQALEY
ncbi:hypothetical protein GCM10028822_36710 [Hymenobacter terrigena]